MTSKVQGLRSLATPRALTPAKPARTEEQKKVAAKARRVLRAEFAKALDLKQKLSDEQSASAPAKGRDSASADKLRSIVASLEGMSRFAIAMGMLTPQENRAIWADFIAKGLYDGWR